MNNNFAVTWRQTEILVLVATRFAHRVTKEHWHNQNCNKKATEKPNKGTEPYNNDR